MDNLNGYCYGPVTVNSVTTSRDTLEIVVNDYSLREHRAVYSGCVYWQIEKDVERERFLLVERIDASDIIAMQTNNCVEELAQITANIEKSVERWQNKGLKFYIHHSDISKKEYLVVAEKLIYN